MHVGVLIVWTERDALGLNNWLVAHNARQLVERPDLPLLYDSGVVYRREPEELWSDVINTLTAGHEDCDALGAWRAAEVLARGVDAIRPGDPGYELAQRLKPRNIRAETMFTARHRKGKVGGYHCVARYRIGKTWFVDDPSARLGMRGGRIDPVIQRRWRQLGVRPTANPLP